VRQLKTCGKSDPGNPEGLHFDVLSLSQTETIHLATLHVLKNTGIKVESRRALRLFADAGAHIEKKNKYNIVRIPPDLVEECIGMAPEHVEYRGRSAHVDFSAAPYNFSFTTFGECINIIDVHSRKFRKSVKKDCRETALVCDSLGEIKVFERPVNPSDTPAATQSLHNAEAIFTNTSKHTFIGAGDVESLKRMAKMAEVCVGGPEHFRTRKIFTTTVCPVSPLLLSTNCCDTIIESALLGIGLLIFPMPLAGATSPVTMAGTLVSFNAEVLSALVLAQLTAQGTPCTYGSASTIMDLTLVDASLGAPEMALLSTGSACLARYYGLPSLICGGLTDSKLPDPQTGYESSYGAMLCALARGNFISGAGVLEQGLTFDYAKLLMDTEMARSISKVVAGIEISPESLALEAIHQVGPAGEFLTHRHTFQNMRSQSTTVNFDRKKRQAWLDAGGKDLAEKAYEEARSILENHKPLPLPPGAAENMADIITHYEKELGIKTKQERG
jgi:trimethylamine---corrinoid protein Co-methyltransferase